MASTNCIVQWLHPLSVQLHHNLYVQPTNSEIIGRLGRTCNRIWGSLRHRGHFSRACNNPDGIVVHDWDAPSPATYSSQPASSSAKRVSAARLFFGSPIEYTAFLSFHNTVAVTGRIVVAFLAEL